MAIVGIMGLLQNIVSKCCCCSCGKKLVDICNEEDNGWIYTDGSIICANCNHIAMTKNS